MIVKFFPFVIILMTTGIIYLSSPTNEDQIKLAYSVSKGQSSCNCTLDFLDNTIAFQMPKVKIIKNESMQSQTEGTLVWTESKLLATDGVIVGDIYIANQSAVALVDLNTIMVEHNPIKQRTDLIEVQEDHYYHLRGIDIVNDICRWYSKR
jgi:hypothetical protein